MERGLRTATEGFRRLWAGSTVLTATGVLMLVVLAGASVGLVLDDRVVTGAPVWLKPAKFAASIAIFTLTLAWILSYLRDWPRTRRGVALLTAATLGLEMVIIVLQAWRGTTSHFNVGTPFDGVLWGLMGGAIALQTLTSVVVAFALWRQRFDDAALGWALRLGMVITIIGASSGGLMTAPTATQMAEAKLSHRMPIVGAHTVGAPDGGVGLPGTGWSLEHGDIRVAHFVGLHAMQALPLILLVLSRRRVAQPTVVRLMMVAAASYLTLFVILLLQALRGQPLLRPDAMTIQIGALWLVGTVAAGWAAASLSRRQAIS